MMMIIITNTFYVGVVGRGVLGGVVHDVVVIIFSVAVE